MVLFLSDMHFGRLPADADRQSEAALVRCLRALRPEALYLLGDVFDAWIEYPQLVPRGYVRFQAALAELTDGGVPVTYLTGNHDPWHIDYFAREMGVRVAAGALHEPIGEANVYLFHGDGVDPTDRLYRLLRPALRHPLPVWLYRTLLPGDTGMRLARWYNRRFSNHTEHESTTLALRTHARQALVRMGGGLAVLGHSHVPERCVWPEGCYVNPGAWYTTRTLAALEAGTLHLLAWDDHAARAIPYQT